jgi:hypothetical protein
MSFVLRNTKILVELHNDKDKIMRVIIAGSRTIMDYKAVGKAITSSNFDITEVVCGCAIGVDRIGQTWAIANGIAVKEMPADWNKYGRQAGFIRNMQMAQYADAAIIIWDGKSPGSKNMISEIKKAEKPYFIDIIEVVPFEKNTSRLTFGD